MINLSQGYILNLAFSTSYICLFIVLTLYKYEVMFRNGVLLVALFGPLYPQIYLLPYFFIVWRVLVGMNVATDQKLYIARRKGTKANSSTEHDDMDKADFSGSATTNHWAVVIQDGDTHFYAHAVGPVILGSGEPKHIVEMTDSKLSKYQLHHVGFVTKQQRERKKVEIVDKEPMVSGNSCQEFAVDMAFQLSSSRTYTFAKIMTLPRIRNTIFYSTVVLSTLLTVFGYAYVRLLNPLILTNLFVAWELSRIGLHNESNQRGYLPVIRAYIRYPTKGNFLVLLILSVFLVYLYQRLGLVECIAIATVLIVVIWLSNKSI